jgi:hypothetical protein
MRAIGARHSITNHFTAQLELDMNAAGINDSVGECPVSFDNYPNIARLGEFNAYPSSSRPSMTEVLEDLTSSNIAGGFRKKDKSLLSIAGGQPNVMPYFILEINRREQELGSEQNTRIGSISGDWAHLPHQQAFPATTDNFSSDTPSSDSSSSKMQGNSNTTPPESNTKSYPYRHIDPGNHGTKPYDIFQADLTSFGDIPAGWDMQIGISDLGNGIQGRTGMNNDFSGFDNNEQPGAEFHDFFGDGPWNTGSLPE